MSTLDNRILIKSVGFGDEKMYIELNSQKVLIVPYTYTTRLKNANPNDLHDFHLIGNGIGIHFDKIDEDISVEGIIRDFSNKTKRINISVGANFLDKADMYAKEHHMSRSALLQKATLEYITS